MEIDIPLQHRESQSLEFKSRSAVDDLDKIVREVVGMLNAEGGEVWIGLCDVNDIAVAVEAIPDAHVEQRRLQDKLVDSVEPSPTHEEASVEVVPVGSAQDVLRILVQPNSKRKPYALVRRQTRYYAIRVGARNRVMSHQEIERAFLDRVQDGVEEDQARVRKEGFNELREERLKCGDSGMWIGIHPITALTIPIEDDGVRDLLKYAEKTRNRAAGWTFANPYKEPQARIERLTGGNRYANIEVGDDGALRCEVDLDALRMGDGAVINPFALMEYPTSVFRLASVLYGQHRADGVPDSELVLADLALFGVAETKLFSGSLLHWERKMYPPWQLKKSRDGDVFGREPMKFALSEVIGRPDNCAYRLYRRIYQAFGFREREISEAFDRKSTRLVFPD